MIVRGAPDAPADPIPFDKAYAELRADGTIQFDLPPVEGRPPPVREMQVDTTEMPTVAPAGMATTTLFWIVVAIAAAGLLFLIIGRFAGWFRRDRSTAAAVAEPEWRPEETVARGLLDDADALAADGRYSEAAHLLLHRSIADIDRHRPASVRKALTSRDIAGLPSLPPSPAVAFAAIVRAVERSLFAGRALDLEAWRDCRAAYERFAFAPEWQR